MFFHYVEWSSEIDCHHDTDLSQENLEGHFKLSWYELKRLKWRRVFMMWIFRFRTELERGNKIGTRRNLAYKRDAVFFP